MCDSLRNEIEQLRAEITITGQKLSVAVEETCKQHDTFLRDLFSTDQQLQKNEEEPEPIFQALTRVELAAQQLAAWAHSDAPTDARGRREKKPRAQLSRDRRAYLHWRGRGEPGAMLVALGPKFSKSLTLGLLHWRKRDESPRLLAR